MASNKLIAIITALTLSVGIVPSHAAYTKAQLEVIEILVLNQDWAELIAYLEANPELLLGADPLAAELRTFVAEARGGSAITAASTASAQRALTNVQKIQSDSY
tara:strand:- start:100 stop:411 length:312 start_codon:yes stop_codon:yes gene_type:complete